MANTESAWQNATAAIADAADRGCAEYVVCGGARNAVMLEVLARLADAGMVRVWSHFEERSAGFFALGRTMATGAPCAVVTTSGTAVAELLPAVVEAHYQARPLIVISADRPAAARGSGSPQTIIQPGIFTSYADSEVEVWNGRGPLHLNVDLPESLDIPELSGGKLTGVKGFKPKWERPKVAELARWLRDPGLRGLVVLVGGLEPGEREEVWHFCRALAVPVIAEATSGLREALIALQVPDGDRMFSRKPPSKVLRLGDCPSGRFWRDLEVLSDVEVFSVTRNGLPGLARECGTRVIAGEVDRVLQALGEIEALGDFGDYLVPSGRDAAMLDELLEAHPDSEPALVRAISRYAAISGPVFLGNSLPVREWNLFAQWERPCGEVRANRGANGIDGQLSSWLGATAETEGAWALVGDLTALYDPVASAMLSQVENCGRVLVVINNRGGRIFDRLPRLESLSSVAKQWLIHDPKADFEAYARLWRMRHYRVATPDDLDAYCPDAAGEKPALIELSPCAKQTASFWSAWDMRS